MLGTRPEAIKLAPVITELEKLYPKFSSYVCATGQHRQMLDQVLELFNITPDYDLDIMTPGQSLAQLTSRVIESLSAVFVKEMPDLVLVQGDTTTAFCGALAAFYNKIPVGHIEAGLRTGNIYSPFPEEINRKLIGSIAHYHFAPTDYAKASLLKEGIDESKVYVTGNTVIDALNVIRPRAESAAFLIRTELEEFIKDSKLVLITGHRRESFGEGFTNICLAIREIADSYHNVVFIYPVHLNPNVRTTVEKILGDHKRIRLIEPLSYLPFIWLMERSLIVLSDSGGVQEEAPSLGKPVLVMRDTTERPEGVSAGNAVLVGTKKERIVSILTKLLDDPGLLNKMSNVRNPYGDGKAAKRIVHVLSQDLLNYY